MRFFIDCAGWLVFLAIIFGVFIVIRLITMSDEEKEKINFHLSIKERVKKHNLNRKEKQVIHKIINIYKCINHFDSDESNNDEIDIDISHMLKFLLDNYLISFLRLLEDSKFAEHLKEYIFFKEDSYFWSFEGEEGEEEYNHLKNLIELSEKSANCDFKRFKGIEIMPEELENEKTLEEKLWFSFNHF